jgi:uncharacterized protein YkwD
MLRVHLRRQGKSVVGSARVVVAVGVVATLALFGWPSAALASGDESDVAAMVNGARDGQGLSSLAYDGKLAAIAESHSAQMAQSGAIFHNSGLPGDVNSSGMRWSAIGENVGLGADVGHVEDAFMGSAEHYANIMDARFNAIGVGVASDGNGHVYVTQVFATIETASAPAGSSGAPVPAVPAPASSAAQPALAPIVSPAFAPRRVVAAGPSEPSVPAGWARAEDGSLVPGSFYACTLDEWVGSAVTPGSVANPPAGSAHC